MNLKKYNKETGTWDIISSGNASGIVVTDPHFLGDQGTTKSVNDVLVELDDKVEETRRNLSWVVINGTIGGGGGGGGTSDTIKLTNAKITTTEGVNYLYATDTKLTLRYLITSTKANQKYSITVTLDGTTIIKDLTAYTGIQGTFEVPDITAYSSSSSHSIVVMASNSEGISVSPYLLTVVESSIKLESSVTSVTATIGLPYYITYKVTNKVLGSATSLIVKNETNGISKTYDMGSFSSVEPKLLDVNFFDLFGGQTPTAGSSYTISAQATTSIDTTVIYSDTVTNRVVVEDGTSLVVLVDGITTKQDVDAGSEPTEFAQSGNISFSFTPYLAGVSIIYYAIRIQRGTITHDIGIFDADSTNFNQNSYVQRGKVQVFSWSIPQEETYLGDYEITLRCWSEKGSPITDSELRCSVIAAQQSLIPTQNPNNTMYAQWNIKQGSFPQISTATEWVSTVPNFILPGQVEEQEVITNLKVYDTNGILSGFLNENGQSKLRLSGESYAIVDMQPFAASTADNANWSRLGFTLSVTFKTDLHPFNDRAVFYIGDYSSDGQFQEGIQVNLEDVIWKYTDGNIKQTIQCKIQQNVVNTLDFVVDQSKGEIKIFVNGVLNAAKEIKDQFTWVTSSKIYLACDYENNQVQNFSDVEFYELNLFRSPLNDKQIVINSLNARVRSELLPDGSVDFVEYNDLKLKNFFSITENTSSSTLWDDSTGTYANLNFSSLIGDVNKKPPLPVALINCANSGFTKAVYEAIGPDSTIYSGCTFSYFDPNSENGSAISTTDMSVQKQGTSSTGYRSKNLEIIFNKIITDDDGKTIGPELFQPKETWMPENQFTLKADVVDSAHANNASIGKWINDHADVLFDKTPPMQELEARRPVDSINTSQKHEKVTIKHTLEGFPIILLIQFDGTSTQEMLGIYSFNLGRGAYYNMGMKFFKNFTTKIKNSSGEYIEQPLPAFITKYETYKQSESYGSINPQQIYSYEFGDNANVISGPDGVQPTALFMQDDLTIIQHVGEFKYNGATQDASAVTDNNIWQRLQLVFSALASMTGEDVDKYRWNVTTKGYEKTGGVYPAQQSWSALADDLSLRLSIRNAYSYFMICVAFGLVDSLGKNMVLRSWNVGGTLTDDNYNKWWPCFYDMDTANGLSNTGEENVAKTAYIDTFSNADTSTGVNSLVITRNDATGGYDEYSARLWDVLRDTRFINTGVYTGSTYDQLWDLWRTNQTLLASADLFVENYFASQTVNCGELLYNYDYKVKYLTKYQKDSETPAAYANIEFLHGTRNNFVRDWIKKRLTFMDGVFSFANNNVIYPYNEKGSFKCGGSESNNAELTIKMNSPAIFSVNIGNSSGGETRYFIDENVETTIRLASLSSFNTQITINNMSEISNMKGLDKIRFQGFMTSMSLPSMSEVNLSSVNTLSSEPVDFSTIFVKGLTTSPTSDIRHIDLSNTKFWASNSGVSTFPVNVENYNKLKTIDISNGCITSLSLPNAALSELNIVNSTIEKLILKDQPFIDEIDFSGCTKLQSVEVNNCNKLTSLDLRNLGDLTSITIIGCSNLQTAIAPNCPKLNVFSVSNCNSLESVNLSGCTNTNLSISLTGAPNLTALDLSNTNTTDVIEFAPNFDSLTNLNLSSSQIDAFQFGNNPVATYNGDRVLDLSPFTFTNLNINNGTFKYIKFRNSKYTPFKVNSSTFSGCLNLTRVFGHIDITSSACFYNCQSYYIHDMPSDAITPIPEVGKWFGPDSDTTEGKIQWDNNEGLDSNITISTTSLANGFRNTMCNLYDVYYVLTKCNDVTILSTCFYTCKNVTSSCANPLNRNMFQHCGKVTNMDTMFYGTNLGGPIYSNEHSNGQITAYNGLLSPLVSVKTFNNVFATDNTWIIDDFIFSKIAEDKTLNITKLSSTFHTSETDKVIFVEDSNNTAITEENADEYRVYAKASRLFKDLPKLQSLEYLFYGIWIEFDSATVQNSEGKTITYCPMFAHNPNLTSLFYVFRNVKGKGTLLNLFGGSDTVFDSDPFEFPTKIYRIVQSFIISSYDTTTSKVYFPVHNSMFRKIASTLQHINGNSSYNINVASTTTPFNGNGINKVFMQEDIEQFPMDIFKNCTKLTSCPNFFYNVQFNNAPSDLELPGDMFINCTQLTNIYGLFEGLINCTYKLSSKGFKNCKLINAGRVFFEDSDSSGDKKEGMIPYGLFYMESQQTKQFSGWNHADAAKLGIDENFGINEDGTHNPDAVLPSQNKYTELVTVINKTITNMAYCLYHFQSEKAECYTRNIGNMTSLDDSGDLITVNENYDPVEFIANPNYDPRETIPNPNYDPNNPGGETETIPNPNYDIHRVIKNTSYDPYQQTWNIWCYDGVYGLKDIIQNSTLYSKVTSGQITTLSPVLPDEFDNEYDLRSNSNPSGYVRRDSMNFICAPDLFRYCYDNANTDISYAMAYVSVKGGITSTYNYGLYGRVCGYLFKPLSNVSTLKGVFHTNYNITPYAWPYGNESGLMFAPELLSYNKALKSIPKLFRGIKIPANVQMPATLLSNNLQLTDVSSLFLDAEFQGPADGIQQMPNEFFQFNNALQNISKVFRSYPDVVYAGQGPKKIGSTLFTSARHKSLQNVSEAFYNQTNTTGSVPEFWNWLNNLTTSNKSNVFYGMSKSKITNSGSIPSSWATGMTE